MVTGLGEALHQAKLKLTGVKETPACAEGRFITANTKLIREKITKPIRDFQLSLEILTTFLSDHQTLFYIYFALWLYLIPRFIRDMRLIKRFILY